MCGVIGIIGPENNTESNQVPHYAALEAYQAMLTLQHRGQDAAGILSFDNSCSMFFSEKDLGLVSSVFEQSAIENMTGNMAIGHTRYATNGGNNRRDVQPMVMGAPFGLGMVHNGNLLNHFSLAKKLTHDMKRQLLSANDLEVLLHFWSHYLLDGEGVKEDSFSFDNIKKAAKSIFDTVNGGYAVIGLIAGEGMVAFRDPKGIRPLSIGRLKLEDGGYKYCLCSETVAMNYLGYEYMRSVAPGEVIFIDLQGKLHSAILTEPDAKAAPCMFEWVYFSAAESVVEDKSVYTARLDLGNQLAKKAKILIDNGKIDVDVVMPVPDTSRTSAISIADYLDLPYREGLIKNRYVQRSFILNTQEKREKAVELKLSPIRSEIEGKNILLVDDSVVRGTTSKRIISLLMRNGAKHVTLGITCPPLRYACYYGIDFPNGEELIANERTIEEISDWVGADRLIYLDETDLKQAIGKEDMCMACLNNEYPTDIKEASEFAAKRKITKDNDNISFLGEIRKCAS